MKRIFLITTCIAVFFGITGLQAQPIQNKLIGVWQMCYPSIVNGQNQMVFMPIWKNISDDGTFCTFMWKNGRNSAVITNRGSYRVDTDSLYTEFVAETSTAPRIEQRENHISFSFLTDDLLEISYRMPGATTDGRELWKRVNVESPTLLNQEDTLPEDNPKRDANGVYFIAEQMPEYPGGTTAMMTRINETLSYPSSLQSRGAEGTSVIRFIVDEKGDVVSTEVFTSAGNKFDAEAIRVVRSLKFKPGKEKGKPVKVYMTVPVSFKL